MRALVVTSCLVVGACGARSSLDGQPPESTPVDAGSNVDAAAKPTCSSEDLSTWAVERYRDEGDYERAAVAVSGVPWVALKRRGGDIELVNLGVDANGIVFRDRIVVAGSPVYPVAFDLDARRFVFLTTTGINWNGDVELWRVDRKDGTVSRTAIGQPSSPVYTIYSAIGLAGDDVALAYARPGVSETEGTIELRDDHLALIESLTVSEVSFTAVRPSTGAIDLYAGATERVRAENGVLTELSVDPTHEVIGGLDGYLVDLGNGIDLTNGTQVWTGAWPHSQISPPAVVRTHGGAAVFSLETELTAVVGHVTGAGLEWLRIASAPDAPGFGAALLPVFEDGRLGLFYLGLEIPHPEQPLRYFGITCR